MVLSPTDERLVVARTLRFHVVQWGEHGVPVVCVHGITANAFYFQALADDLARDHRVFAYDLRGRGDSERSEEGYGIPAHAQDLAALFDALGLERPVVLGHSLGTFIALYFASHFPTKLRKLILVEGGVPLPWETSEDQPAWLRAAINRLGTPVPSFDAYLERLKAAPFLAPYWNAYMDLYYQHDVFHQPDGSVIAKCSREASVEDERSVHAEGAPEAQWGQVVVPTLLLRAGQGLFSDHDQMVPAEAAAAAARATPDCRLVDFPTLNHYTILFGVEPGPIETIRAFLR
jgi:pimeloyl-ACP methyl ester carboxylesterase